MVDVVCAIGVIIGAFVFGLFMFITYLEQKKKEEKRRIEINRHRDEWGYDICQMLIKKEIAIDMNEEMVRLSWGKPTTIEQKELTKTGQKTRWIYGVPRHGAKYIWFKNGIVTKIKQ